VPLYISAASPEKYSLSPAQALTLIKRFAVGLQKLEGVGQGDVVMMFSPNHVFVPVGYLGAIAAGGIFCGCSVSFGVSGMFGSFFIFWYGIIDTEIGFFVFVWRIYAYTFSPFCLCNMLSC